MDVALKDCFLGAFVLIFNCENTETVFLFVFLCFRAHVASFAKSLSDMKSNTELVTQLQLHGFVLMRFNRNGRESTFL